MTGSRNERGQADKGLIWVSLVLLVGIVVLAAGYVTGNRIAFYAGLLVTLGGVLAGIQRLFLRER